MSFFKNILNPPFKVSPTSITGKVGDGFKLQTNRRATFWAEPVPLEAEPIITVDASGQGRLLRSGWSLVRVYGLDKQDEGVRIDVPVTVHADDGYDIAVTIDGKPVPKITLLSLHERLEELERWRKNHEGAMHGSL